MFSKNKSIFSSLVRKTKIVVDKDEEYKLIEELLDLQSKSKILSFINAHGVNLMFKNDSFKSHILSSDFLLRDGVGIKILYKFIKRNSGLNLNGTDFIPKIIKAAIDKNYQFVLLGTSDKILDLVQKKPLLARAKVLKSLNGFKKEDEYLSLINDIQEVNVVYILGMGMPKQELMADLIRERKPNSLIINGGAVLDFISGEITRAPKLMQMIGCEWLYRLCLEPKRLFSRYVIGNAVFLSRSLIFKIFGKINEK